MVENLSRSIIVKIPSWPDFLLGSYRCFNQDERHITRINSEFVLIFMFDNTLYFTENHSDISIKKGEWYIQLPGLKQEGKKGSPAPYYYYIHFQALGYTCYEMDISPLMGNVDGSSPIGDIYLPIRGAFDIEKFKPLFNKLDILNKRHPTDFLGRQSIFLNILEILMMTTYIMKNEDESLEVQLMDFLAENYDKQITCKELTDKFHFSSDYLTRRLKKYYGVTPWQYIQQLRIEKAKELLGSTDYTLAFITDAVGYNDLSVFYKAFRKQTNIAPGTWRIRYRGIKE